MIPDLTKSPLTEEQNQTLVICPTRQEAVDLLAAAGFEPRTGAPFLFSNQRAECTLTLLDDAFDEVFKRAKVSPGAYQEVLVLLPWSWLRCTSTTGRADFSRSLNAALDKFQRILLNRLQVTTIILGGGTMSGFNHFCLRSLGKDHLSFYVASQLQPPAARLEALFEGLHARGTILATGYKNNGQGQQAAEVQRLSIDLTDLFLRLAPVANGFLDASSYQDPPVFGPLMVFGPARLHEWGALWEDARAAGGELARDSALALLPGLLGSEDTPRRLSAPSPRRVRRRRLLIWAALFLVFCLALTFTTLARVSYERNCRLLADINDTIRASDQAEPHQRGGLDPLLELGTVLKRLERMVAGQGSWLDGFGLEQATRLLPNTKKVFLTRVTGLIMSRTLTGLEEALAQLMEAHAAADAATRPNIRQRLDDLARLYNMFNAPHTLQVGFAARISSHIYMAQEGIPFAAEDQDRLRRILLCYFQVAQRDGLRIGPPDPTLARRVDALFAAGDRLLERLIRPCPEARHQASAATSKFLAMQRAIRQGGSAAFTTGEEVPDALTVGGITTCVVGRLAKAANGQGKQGADLASYPAKVVDRTAQATSRFLAKMRVRPVKNFSQLQLFMETLTRSPASLQVIVEYLEAVANAAQSPAAKAAPYPSQMQSALSSLHDRYRSIFTLTSKAFDEHGRRSGVQIYINQLGLIWSSLELYLQSRSPQDLLKAASVTREARRLTGLITSRLKGDLLPLRDLFLQPLDRIAAVLQTRAVASARQVWRDEVCVKLSTQVGDQFYKTPAGADALPEDLDALIGKGGQIWTFMNQNLSSFVERRGAAIRARTGGPAGFRKILSVLNSAAKIRDQLLTPTGGVRRTRIKVQIQAGSRAALTLCGKSLGPAQGGSPVNVTWPCSEDRVTLWEEQNGELVKLFSFSGEWALFRLVDAAHVEQRAGWRRLTFNAQGPGSRVTVRIQPAKSDSLLFKRPVLACG